MAYGPDTEELLKRIQNCNADLDVVGLHITSLPELPAGLQRLDCSRTQITSLPELPATLQFLYCYRTPLLLQREEDETITDYNLRWREWREKEAKERITARTKVVKEEMMMVFWHPDRYDKWAFDDDE